jgi:hypothetical protein
MLKLLQNLFQQFELPSAMRSSVSSVLAPVELWVTFYPKKIMALLCIIGA